MIYTVETADGRGFVMGTRPRNKLGMIVVSRLPHLVKKLEKKDVAEVLAKVLSKRSEWKHDGFHVVDKGEVL